MTEDHDRAVAAARSIFSRLTNGELADELVWAAERPRRYSAAQRDALMHLAALRLREKGNLP